MTSTPIPDPSGGHAGHWHRRFRHSLRARLVGLFLLLAIGTTVVFLAGSREAFSTGWREWVRPLVADYIDRLAAEIGDPPSVARAQALASRLPILVVIDGPLVQWRSRPARPGTHGSDDGPHDPALRALVVRRTADGHQIRFGLAAWPVDDERPRWVGGLTLAGLLVLTGLAYGTVRRLFRPLDDIRAGARRYEAGEFDPPIPVRRRDELGDLAQQVNAMAVGLRRMLEGQRTLLLSISHELRSPLTRARLNAELLPESPEREALLRDLGQMRDLIANLLESERLAAGQATLQRAPVDLNALVREVVDAQFAGQAIGLSLDPLVPMLELDAARIQLLVRNLLDNACRHGRAAVPDAAVQLSTSTGPGQVRLMVRDHGPGVDPAQIERLGQAFHRPDASRSRDRGGVGLGLYLCRRVAQSHGGDLRIRAAQPGLEVSVELPLPSLER